MPLNETDKAWIRQEIQAAHKKQGSGKVVAILRDWGGLAIAATVAAAIGIFSLDQWSAYLRFSQKTEDRLTSTEQSLNRIGEIEQSLNKLSASVSTLQIQQIASEPVSPASIKQTRQIIESAKTQRQRIDPGAIPQLGNKLISSSGTLPAAWPAIG